MNRTLSYRVALSITASAATICAALLTATPAGAQGNGSAALRLSTTLLGVQDKSASQYYNDGVIAFNAGKVDEAITAFTNAIKKRANYADAYYGRGIAYNRKKEYAKALADLNETIKVKAKFADAYIERATANAGLNNFPAALADYTAADQNGDAAMKTEIGRYRGGLYFQMKDYDKAIADWKGYLAANPNAPAALHYNIGLAYLLKKQYPEAVSSLTTAIKGMPTSAVALASRAEAYMGMNPKDYAKAIADGEAALKIDANDMPTVELLGIAYDATKQYDKIGLLADKYPAASSLLAIAGTAKLKAGDYKGAIPLLTKFLAIPANANNLPVQTNLALAYLGDKQFDNAIRVYDGVIKADPKSSQAYLNRGVAYYNRDMQDKALLDFDQAIKLDPKNYDAYVNKSLVGMKLGLAGKTEAYSQVIDACTAALAIKDDPTVRYRRGGAYFNMKQYDKAIPDLEAYQKAKPTDKEVTGLLADAYKLSGKSDIAIAKYSEAIKANPTDAANYVNRGGLYIGLKKWTEAAADFDKAVQLKPTDTVSKYNRGLCQFNLKNWAACAADMTAVLAADAKNMDALSLRADANYNAKKYKEAADDYAAILAMNPPAERKAEALKGLGDAATASGDPKLAVATWTKIIGLQPDNMDALKYRGIAYLKDKQAPLAQKDLEAYAAKKADDADVWFNLGLIYRDLKDGEKEAMAFEKSTTIKADFAAASSAGTAYTKLGSDEKLIDADSKKAAAYLDKAIAMFDIALKSQAKPESLALAHFNKAVAYEKKAYAMQDDSILKGAIEGYKKYLELNPTATDKKEIEATIKDLQSKAG
jgi:tetratricopeptide (TPR) repeat protein